MRSRSLIFAACGIFALACHSSTEPTFGTAIGRFVATTLDVHALPAKLDSSATGFTALVADTLELDGDGGARRAFTVRSVDQSTGAETVHHVSLQLEYRVNGSRIEVGFFGPCAADAVCLANDVGVVTPVSVSLSTHLYGGGSEILLARTGP